MISSFPVDRMSSLNLPSKPTSAHLAPKIAPKKRRAGLLFWVALFGLAILLGGVAEVDLEHARFLGLESPPCLIETLFGDHKLCPGFGLTRSTALVIHGHWDQAWRLNPGGIAIAVVLIGGFFLYLLGWVKGGFSPKMLITRKLGRSLFLGAVFFPWCYRIFLN